MFSFYLKNVCICANVGLTHYDYWIIFVLSQSQRAVCLLLRLTNVIYCFIDVTYFWWQKKQQIINKLRAKLHFFLFSFNCFFFFIKNLNQPMNNFGPMKTKGNPGHFALSWFDCLMPLFSFHFC